MKNKKGLISTLLMCLGLVLAVVAIFCFFGDALKIRASSEIGLEIEGTIKSVFSFMFGGEAKFIMSSLVEPGKVETVGVLTTSFVFEILAILLVAIVIIGAVSKKIDMKRVSSIVCVISILMLVSAILMLVSKNGMVKALGIPEEYLDVYEFSLGSGVIAYVVLAFISVASNLAGLIVAKKAN